MSLTRARSAISYNTIMFNIRSRKTPTPLEQFIMDYVWAHPDCTAEMCREGLASQRRLKDSTIRTILRKLEEKGYVTHAVDGRTFVYRAVDTQRNVAVRGGAAAHRPLLRRVRGGVAGGAGGQPVVGAETVAAAGGEDCIAQGEEGMTTIQFLAEWALRSSILILGGALLLRALRVKDPSIRLAAWTAMLCGSLAIPALTAALPKAPLAVLRVPSGRAEAPVVVHDALWEPVPAVSRSGVGAERHGTGASQRFDWARAAIAIYALVALALLLRLCFGLAMSLRLLRGSRATGQATEGIEIRESDRVATPVTLGIARPAIVLPVDWRQWDGAKLDAVLAHERSHIRRHDPAVQLLSAIHRVLLWHSPLSWFLHRRIVRVAEEASDDAAVAVTRDRALYAEVLLDFMQGRGARCGQRAGRECRWRGTARQTSASIAFWMERFCRAESRDGAWRRFWHWDRRSRTWWRRRAHRAPRKHRPRTLRRRPFRGLLESRVAG